MSSGSKYTTTKLGERQLSWRRGWNLTGIHTSILSYLKKRTTPATEDEIWRHVRGQYRTAYASNVRNGILDMLKEGYIRKSIKRD